MAAEAVYERTTDGIPAADRLDYWREDVLRRMEPRAALDATRPFRARLRRIAGTGAELVEHASDGLAAERDAARCRRDGRDEIGIDLMLDSSHAILEQCGQCVVRPGDMHILDFGRPSRVVRSRHRAVGLIIARSRVREVLGRDPAFLAGRPVPVIGMAAVLRSHLRATLDNAALLSPAHRAVAVDAAVEMACAMLEAQQGTPAEVERVAEGVYLAALGLIRRDCADPGMTPMTIAATLGCSRASLYRAFARHGESVAAAIWAARLDRAWHMLAAAPLADVLVSEIALHCGFLDHSTFDRMFKRRYGMPPRDARGSRLEHRTLFRQ